MAGELIPAHAGQTHPGRPRVLQITPEVLEHVESLAAQGMPKRWIALHLGISHDTLTRREKESAEFAEAVARGQATCVARLTKHMSINAFEPTHVNPGGNPYTQERMLQRIIGKTAAEGEDLEGEAAKEVREIVFRVTRSTGHDASED